MKIEIADVTLCVNTTLGFKEKIEIARCLENLDVDVIELPEIKNARTDALLVRTLSSFVKKATLSVGAGSSLTSVSEAANALSGAKRGRIRIELPLSPVGMEYVCHKKGAKMIDYIAQLVTEAKKYAEVEFCILDAVRAERSVLAEAIKSAREAGATAITLCDSAAKYLPDEFATFVREVKGKDDYSLGVRVNDDNGLAVACAVLATKSGATLVKTSTFGSEVSFRTFCNLVKNCGLDEGISTGVKYTELNRAVKQIERITEGIVTETKKSVEGSLTLAVADDASVVMKEVATLGYDLSDEDKKKVYEEFKRVATKKKVGAKELDAIVASVALSCPSTYKLVSYLVNNGNMITPSAQITLEEKGKTLQGISIGDGPIDASFRAVEQIIGHHYELDDFRISSVTEGKEAVGSAVVKLRASGKVYSGNGISTDIIGASIRAYISAINKIVYEENQ